VNLNIFDVLVLVVILAFFVIGYIQGTLRRLIGLAITLVALLAALGLRDPVGEWLARYWTQFAPEYSKMLAFGGSFLVIFAAASITAQTFYRRQQVFSRSAVLDEVVGGLLGAVQAILLVGILILGLDSYYTLRGLIPDPDEWAVLRNAFSFYDTSQAAAIFRDSLIPGFLSLVPWIAPADLRALFAS